MLRVVSIIISPLIIVATVFAACANKKVPTADTPKGEIFIGVLDDLTGPMSPQCSGRVDGILDAIRYINKKRGGIEGYQLKAIVIDHKMDASRITPGWDRLNAEKVPVVFSTLAMMVPVIVSMSDRDHIPIVTGAGDMDLLFPKEQSYYFADAPQLMGVIQSACMSIEKEWARMGKKDPPKVVFDVISIGNLAKMGEKAATMYAGSRGWEYLITRTPFAPADVTTQVLQAKEFGGNYLHLSSIDASMIAWMKELDRQNFHPVVSGLSGLGSDEMWDAVGELAAGARPNQRSVQWTETDVPMVRLMHELNAEWYPDKTWRPTHYCRGFALFLIVEEAIQRALQNVDYENLNSETLAKAMVTISDFDPGIGVGYTWAPTDRQGLRGGRWYEWTGEGKQVPITDWEIFDPLPAEQKTNAWWLQD